MTKDTSWFIQWFPLVIFLSLMTQPHLLHFSAFSMTFIPLMFLLWLALIHSVQPIEVPRIGFVLLLLIVVSQLMLLFSGEVKNIGSMCLGFIWVMVALLVYSASRQLTKYADIFMYSFIVASFMWMIVAAVVWFGLTDGNAITFLGLAVTHIAQVKPTGPFSNGNVFGIMMLCAWIISVKYWLDGKKYAPLMLFLAFLFLIWVFASMSRGAWLAGCVVGLGLFIYLYKNKQWLNMCVLIGSILIAWWIADAMVRLVSDNLNLADRADDMLTMGARLVLYPAVFDVWKQHWMLGIGLGNLTGYFLTGQSHVLPSLPENIHGMGAVSSAHNHLLYILSGAGIAGLIAWSSVAYVLWRSYLLNACNVALSSWAPLNVALALWVQGLFNITMNEALPFFMFFLFLGLGVGFQNKTMLAKNSIVLPRQIWLMVYFIASLSLIVASYQTFKSWNLYRYIAMASVMGPERGVLYKQLFELENDNIYPYIMNSVVSDFMLIKKSDTSAWLQIQPNIQKALDLEEWPQLYQALFYTYMLQEDWDKACELGKFLKNQRWQHDENIEAYKNACLGKPAEDFKLGW